MIKVLNLYAGIGGNRKLWTDVDVTAVEIDPDIAKIYQDFFPDDKVLVEDAHEYLLHNYKDFDFIWSSPPCQSHSRMMRTGRNRRPRFPDMKLYEEIIFLNQFCKTMWIVENVKPYYTELIKPNAILGRHYVWSNFKIDNYDPPKFKKLMKDQNLKAKTKLMNWLDMHFEKNVYYDGNHCATQILRNAVHPQMGLHIFNEYKRTGF
jgi:DNA (cytosine-5)-methyltransferase 1